MMVREAISVTKPLKIGGSGKAKSIVEAWPGGPLRRSPKYSPGTYDCAGCKKSVQGVYFTSAGWLCAACREPYRVRGVQPEGLRRHREHKIQSVKR
jgi:hypothetical protein